MRTSIWMCALVCVASVASAQQRAPAGGSVADTLRLTRRQAIAMALLSNPTIGVAKEQTAQVQAQRVEGMAIPDPLFSAAYDSMPRITGFGPSVSKPVSLSVVVPFPDKLRLESRLGTANVNASQQNLRLVEQGIAASASQAYDAVLVAAMHRRDLLEARTLGHGLPARSTQARFNAGTVARLDVIKAQVDSPSRTTTSSPTRATSPTRRPR